MQYLVHYLDGAGSELAAAMRRFDVPLEVGQEFTGPHGLCRVVSLERPESAFEFGHAWAEPA